MSVFSRARSILIPRGNFSLLIDPVTRVIPKHEDGIWPSLVYVARTFVKLDARETPVSRDLSDRRNPIAGTALKRERFLSGQRWPKIFAKTAVRL